MSGNTGRDLSASPETEQLLSGHACGDTSNTHARRQPAARWSTDEPYSQDDGVSSSESTLRGASTRLSRDNAQIRESSLEPAAAATTMSRSIIANDAVENDDPPPYASIPPPYSAIVPPNHVGWTYGLYQYDDTYPTGAPPYRVEIPLAPLQTSSTSAAAGFHPEEINGQHASLPMPLTPYRFFKFGYSRGSLASREMSLPDNGIAEKIDDRKSRRYGAILVAAAVIIFLMALSLTVRFVMEKSWWRG